MDLAVAQQPLQFSVAEFHWFASMAIMNEGDPRNEIERLEVEIDELAAKIESCRKFILAGRAAVAVGGMVLIATLVGAIQFNPSLLGIAAAAVLSGIVAAGSNHSTAREAKNELAALEAKRSALIGQLELRLVPNQKGRSGA
jgi:hypothetical protein